jgi:hypothetical protein
MTKYTTTSTFFILLFFQCFSLGLHAQLSFVCPTGIVISEDTTNNDPALWNNNYWFDALLASHDLAEGAQTFVVFVNDSCSGGPTHYRFILDLDLNGDGLRETRVDSDSLPGRDSVHFNNIASGKVTGGEIRRFDFRPIPAAERYRFALENDSVGPYTRRLMVKMIGNGTSIPAQLPYGTHSIQWFATPVCGPEQYCCFWGHVRDAAPPQVSCLNGLSVNIWNTQPPSVALWASDFLISISDNYSPSDRIRIAIRRKDKPDGMGKTHGFPRNADGTPQTRIQFYCQDIGLNDISLWAIDANNLADSCATYVLIESFTGNCELYFSDPITGTLRTENGKGIADAEVTITNSNNGIPIFQPLAVTVSDTFGTYVFLNAPPFAGNTQITPELDIDHLNGVNTWDLTLISRHILGLEALNSPYKIIAADANKSGTVTTFDIVELRKLILGSLPQLPNNTSWRFVDKTQVFTNPANPFADVIRENVQVTVLPPDFIGVKIGDVDNSVVPHFTENTGEARTHSTATVRMNAVSADKTGTLLQFSPAADLAGYQFTLHVGPNTLAEIIPQGNLTNEHFAVHERDGETAITVVSEDGAQPFAVRLRNSDVAPESISISGEITPAVGYDRAGTPTELLLHSPTDKNTLVLYPNTPNPWRETTAFRFELPRAGTATLRFFDATGRLVHESQMEGAKGINTHKIINNPAFLPGLYTFSLEFEGQFFVQKTIKF